MKKTIFKLVFATILGLGGVASAQTSDSITGLWKTFDDETNQPAALVQIIEKNGVFSGSITKLLDTSGPSTCEKCTDSRKGKPILGMEILSGLKKIGESYSGGQILDPDDGEIYKAEMKLKDQGAKLDLRAYIGIPLLGRTQTWIREK
ncbi:DUF2147 domain-containing protein [Polynucleobacter tropicus]|uniref:DUF2147 domain-containing protein n=1 Tax=Polynucleobacter tropicus TaxID=1743174 RepID=A0A6M9Q1Q8_9BURK|nr:DUF2147 domain-containing protein [Polynucleobacter tropicus]